MLLLVIHYEAVSSVVYCVANTFSLQENGLEDTLNKLREGINQCLEEYGEINSDGYHVHRIGLLVKDCYTAGAKQGLSDTEVQTLITELFSGVSCAWQDE
tara:strand:- start:4562 stop:4861 length:300 start_codon:yes stop_codon:yes gene_type:complete